jgi:hypothetical protein
MDMQIDMVREHAPVVKHAVKHVVHAAPVIKQGISMLTLLISNVSTAIVVGGLAWYIRGRGFAGVQIDINNIKTDIENLKAKIAPTSVPAAS